MQKILTPRFHGHGHPNHLNREMVRATHLRLLLTGHAPSAARFPVSQRNRAAIAEPLAAARMGSLHRRRLRLRACPSKQIDSPLTIIATTVRSVPHQ